MASSGLDIRSGSLKEKTDKSRTRLVGNGLRIPNGYNGYLAGYGKLCALAEKCGDRTNFASENGVLCDLMLTKLSAVEDDRLTSTTSTDCNLSSPISRTSTCSPDNSCRRRPYRFHSSESIDSGIAVTTDCSNASTSSGQSDITEPRSPPSPDSPQIGPAHTPPPLPTSSTPVGTRLPASAAIRDLLKTASMGCLPADVIAEVKDESECVVSSTKEIVAKTKKKKQNQHCQCRNAKDNTATQRKKKLIRRREKSKTPDSGYSESFQKVFEQAISLQAEEDEKVEEVVLLPPPVQTKPHPLVGGISALVVVKPVPVKVLSLCRWVKCDSVVKSSDDLVDHIRKKHVDSQLDAESFVCLWEGCKVLNKPSCSLSWLERHMLSHGGNKPFKCIVDGCKVRLANQTMLQRHVNSHFKNKSKSQTNSVANDSATSDRLQDVNQSVSCCASGCKDGRKRDSDRADLGSGGRASCGKKRKGKAGAAAIAALLLRRPNQHADYMDSGIMERVQYRLVQLAETNSFEYLTFTAKVCSMRTDQLGCTKYLVKWLPQHDKLSDEWLTEVDLRRTGFKRKVLRAVLERNKDGLCPQSMTNHTRLNGHAGQSGRSRRKCIARDTSCPKKESQ